MPQLHVERGLRWREEWREEGRAEGREEGRAEGVAAVRNILVDMAEERFGEHAAQRLAVALEGRSSPETFTTVGKLMFACDTPQEFIERLPT